MRRLIPLGATGATQNHIHLHAWKQDYTYAAERAGALRVQAYAEGARSWRVGAARVHILDWYETHAICLQVDAQAPSDAASGAREAGQALHRLLQSAAALDTAVAWNVVFCKERCFIFMRSSEQAPEALPGFSFGCNQMMGYWNVDTAEQFETLDAPRIARALRQSSHTLAHVEAILRHAADTE